MARKIVVRNKQLYWLMREHGVSKKKSASVLKALNEAPLGQYSKAVLRRKKSAAALRGKLKRSHP
jgi:hypothetical protein